MSKKILVVEDTEDNRQILRDLLSMAGYEMVEAHEVFHLWVLAGAAYHWKFVSQFADGTVDGQPIHPTKVIEAVEAAVETR